MQVQGKRVLLFMLVAVLLSGGCRPSGESEKTPESTAFTYVKTGMLGLPDLPVPGDNPQTPEKIALGRELYSDARFSSDGTVSCATCHNPATAFVDRLRVSKGVKGLTGTRNAPTVLNSAFLKTQFWDGRRPDLESQAKDPLLNPVEHGLSDHEQLLKIVRADQKYTSQFETVFQVKAEQITIDHVVKAIAAFERTIISGDSPFDRYLFGKDEKAMSPAAIRGFAVYTGKGRCQECHMIGETSATFTDDKFHNLGVGFALVQPKLQQILEARAKGQAEASDEKILTDRETSELGRFAITGLQEDLGAFKTPTLRNIALTAPYMHDGSLATLQQVIDLYDRGGEANPFLASGIRPLGLTPQEKSDLIEFMKALTSPDLPK
ncbi:MAG: cytochrome-c peroxidase [Spirochaetae bacterium HGW-Spirochaetae-10]|nr:MAG: cytochrome-c peroxidase [Spirochaetae bacterium HGW-Spirochaetae-10]